MRTLKTSEAAALLNVSPNTLRAWERRFGYPKPQRSVGKHRLYTHGEIAALRDALHEGLSISSAVSVAREALASETHSLVGALSSLELDRADGAMEAALALRSLERAVEEVLLPSLSEVRQRHGADSAPWALAARWGNEWLRRAQRLAPPPTRPLTFLIGDASDGELDNDYAALRSLELFCARGGARVMGLPVRGLSGLGDVIGSMTPPPSAIVIAGTGAEDDSVARWGYAARAAAGPLPISLFRRGGRADRMRSRGISVLSDKASVAQNELFATVFQIQTAPLPVDAMPVPRRVTRLGDRREAAV